MSGMRQPILSALQRHSIGLAVCLGLCGASVTHASAAGASTFEADTGVPASAVDGLERGDGVSHYRMRTYRFWIDLERLDASSRTFGMATPRADDLFGRAADLLFSVAAGLDRGGVMEVAARWMRWYERLQSNLSPGAIVAALGTLLPPYRQVRFACYPRDQGFAFRIAVIEPKARRDGKREVYFGAAGTLPAIAPATPCAATTATFHMPMAGDALLPFPFAARSFAEMVSPAFAPQALHYHGTLFIDSPHFFRFEATERQFRALVAHRSMMDQPHADDGFMYDAERYQLAWWISQGDAAHSTWYQRCQRLDSNIGLERATWRDGVVYWFRTGTPEPLPNAQPCAASGNR